MHHAAHFPRHAPLLGLAAALAVAACSDGTTGSVSLSLSSQKAGVIAAAAPRFSLSGPSGAMAGDSAVLTLGNDTIILRSVQVVLRQVELKRVEASACDSTAETSACEEFRAGPVLATIPLAAATGTIVSVDAPAGQYDEFKFQIHRPEMSTDAAFIAANPDFDSVSIRVTGTFSLAGSRSDFVYTTDLDQDLEISLSPPVTVTSGTPLNVTLRFDVSTWFLNGGKTAFVDPASGNKGQTNESLVKDNIHNSIEAFRDDNRDGHDDDHEGS
ncbi:MAG TPA: hypothetical protein VFK78_04260 [Gemmatimonadales bacterium]|nr:hypothetical protein [Gemmatimonadales bacterium]